MRPRFEDALQFWKELLTERGFPQRLRWVFQEDFCRASNGFAFRLRSEAEANRLVSLAYAQVNPVHPLAFVAYGSFDGETVCGLHGDVFSADDDVCHDDWQIFFDTRCCVYEESRVITDAAIWEKLREAEPVYLSELDYLFSAAGIARRQGLALD